MGLILEFFLHKGSTEPTERLLDVLAVDEHVGERELCGLIEPLVEEFGYIAAFGKGSLDALCVCRQGGKDLRVDLFLLLLRFRNDIWITLACERLHQRNLEAAASQ